MAIDCDKFSSVPHVGLFLLVWVLSGCAAFAVPATNNPDTKIRDAYILFDEQQRPSPAERLIREAIAIYSEQGNELGLAEAYRAYGFFFRSPAVEKWRKAYESAGFMEPGATFANRYEKSISYFEQAILLFEKHDKQAALTNVHLNLGFTYEFAKQPEKACEQYRKSLLSHRRQVKQNPHAKVTLPKGVDSYEGYLNLFFNRLNCA